MKKYSLHLCLIFLLCACQTIPKNALVLSPESLQERQMQTRKFETKDEAKILEACAGLLQDMGFNIDESETQLGLIVGSKMRSAENAGQIVTAIVLAALTGVLAPVDKEQKMRACLITKPVGEKGEYIAVRVTFQRIVWNTQNVVSVSESIKDDAVYQEFFEKLSKALFLESQQI